MGKLEELANNNKFTTKEISELIHLYAKCVEYYDSKKDPISKYF